MTSIHHIDNTPSASTLTNDNVAGANQTYFAPESINEVLLTELLHHGEKVSPTKALPELPRATVDYTSDGLVAIPSMGAAMMEAIVSMASLMRRQNAELRAHEVNAMAAEMENQAKSLENKASYLLHCGIVAGALNIVAGAASLGMGAKVSTHIGTALEGEFTALNQKLNMLSTGISSGLGGGASVSQSMGQSWGTAEDAAIKLSEAAVERTRSRMEFMKSLEDSMRDVINKAIATQDAIQQNTNQTRSKILG